jgi:predicted ATP-binding protein involved in virulence
MRLGKHITHGSGKTSLLNAVSDVLTGYSTFISTSNSNYQALNKTNVVHIKGESFQGRYRFEPQYPVKISTTVNVFHDDYSWTLQNIINSLHVRLVAHNLSKFGNKKN